MRWLRRGAGVVGALLVGVAAVGVAAHFSGQTGLEIDDI
jgi:hypothetical protein